MMTARVVMYVKDVDVLDTQFSILRLLRFGGCIDQVRVRWTSTHSLIPAKLFCTW
jgi:hypothetical protein